MQGLVDYLVNSAAVLWRYPVSARTIPSTEPEVKMIKLTACFGCIFTMDNKFLAYQSLGGVGFRVLRSDIEAVDVDVLATGGGLLRLIGKGTELARVELPGPAAEKAAAWISEHRQGVVPAGPPIRPGGTTPRQFARAMAVLALIWCFLYAVGRLLVDKP